MGVLGLTPPTRPRPESTKVSAEGVEGGEWGPSEREKWSTRGSRSADDAVPAECTALRGLLLRCSTLDPSTLLPKSRRRLRPPTRTLATNASRPRP